MIFTKDTLVLFQENFSEIIHYHETIQIIIGYESPFQIRFNDGDWQEHRGIIIKEDVVLTATHCVEDKHFNKETFKVLAGVLDLRFTGATSMKIKEIQVHPRYEKPKVYYDVALLILTEPLKFSKYINSICLPSTVLLSHERRERNDPLADLRCAIRVSV